MTTSTPAPASAPTASTGAESTSVRRQGLTCSRGTTGTSIETTTTSAARQVLAHVREHRVEVAAAEAPHGIRYAARRDVVPRRDEAQRVGCGPRRPAERGQHGVAGRVIGRAQPASQPQRVARGGNRAGGRSHRRPGAATPVAAPPAARAPGPRRRPHLVDQRRHGDVVAHVVRQIQDAAQPPRDLLRDEQPDRLVGAAQRGPVVDGAAEHPAKLIERQFEYVVALMRHGHPGVEQQRVLIGQRRVADDDAGVLAGAGRRRAGGQRREARVGQGRREEGALRGVGDAQIDDRRFISGGLRLGEQWIGGRRIDGGRRLGELGVGGGRVGGRGTCVVAGAVGFARARREQEPRAEGQTDQRDARATQRTPPVCTTSIRIVRTGRACIERRSRRAGAATRRRPNPAGRGSDEPEAGRIMTGRWRRERADDG